MSESAQAALSQALIESIASGSTNTGSSSNSTRFDKIREDTIAYLQVFVLGQQVHGAGGFNSINIDEPSDPESATGKLLAAARANGGKASFGNPTCYVTLHMKGSKKPVAPVDAGVFDANLFDPDAVAATEGAA